MWHILHNLRVLILSVVILTNIVQKKDNPKLHNNNDNSINLTIPEACNNNSSALIETKLKPKKYADFIIRNVSKVIDNNIYVLGLFDLSTPYGRRSDGYSELGAARLAIEHINKQNYVDGYQLQLLVNDSKCDPGTGIDRYFHALHSKYVISMLLGGACANVTESLARIVPYWNIVQVSYGGTAPILSDRRKFPLFYRTVPSETTQNAARVALIRYFSWHTVATFSQRENTYMLPLNSLVAELEDLRIDCSTSFTFSIENYKEQLYYLKQSDVRITIASFSDAFSELLFCEIYTLGMYGADYVWFLIEHKLNFTNITKCKSWHIAKVLEGTFTFVHYNRMHYEEKSISKLENKDFNRLLNHTEFSRYAYDAVWTMAIILRRLQRTGLKLNDFYYNQVDFVEDMLDEIKTIKFIGASGSVSFNGADRIGDTTVRQMQHGRTQIVALHESASDRLVFKCDGCLRVRWQGDAVPISKRVLVRRLDTIPTYAFYAVGTYSTLALVFCVLFFYFNFHYRDCKVVKLSSPRLNNIAVLGCALVFAATVLLGVDSATIISSSYYSSLCMTRVFLLSAGISLAFGAVFAKTYRVHRIFTYACTSAKDRMLKDCPLILSVLVLVIFDAAVVCAWIVMDPLQRQLNNLTIETSATDRSILYQPQVEVCRSNNTTGWFIALYGYKGFLLAMGVYMAWQTRHIKIDALNDAHEIGICVYGAVFSSILTLLANCMAEYTLLAYLTQTMSILTAATMTLLLLFVPKVRLVCWGPKSGPLMAPGLRLESNTRRLDVEDRGERTFRLLVQNRVYCCELDALDKEIARLEDVLAQPRASWPCMQIYKVSSQFLSQSRLNEIHDYEMDIGSDQRMQQIDGGEMGQLQVFDRIYSINDEISNVTSDRCSSVTSMHGMYIDIEEHI